MSMFCRRVVISCSSWLTRWLWLATEVLYSCPIETSSNPSEDDADGAAPDCGPLFWGSLSDDVESSFGPQVLPRMKRRPIPPRERRTMRMRRDFSAFWISGD